MMLSGGRGEGARHLPCLETDLRPLAYKRAASHGEGVQMRVALQASVKVDSGAFTIGFGMFMRRRGVSAGSSRMCIDFSAALIYPTSRRTPRFSNIMA